MPRCQWEKLLWPVKAVKDLEIPEEVQVSNPGFGAVRDRKLQWESSFFETLDRILDVCPSESPGIQTVP